jgi:hypothetical protein
MPSTGKSQYLKNDPALLASTAGDAFGGGSGNAELLIAANQLRWSPHLEAAQLVPADKDATLALDRDDVVKAVDMDSDLVLSYAVHGRYVVVVVGPPRGRLHKVPLHLSPDGALERAEQQDTPEIAALRAQIEAQGEVEEAKREAERIIAEAQAKANEIAAKAASDAQEAAAQRAIDAEESGDAEVNTGTEVDPAQGAATPATPGTPSSTEDPAAAAEDATPKTSRRRSS